jgi:hypothetical protein
MTGNVRYYLADAPLGLRRRQQCRYASIIAEIHQPSYAAGASLITTNAGASLRGRDWVAERPQNRLPGVSMMGLKMGHAADRRGRSRLSTGLVLE